MENEIISNGTKVSLPCKEEGIVKKYVDKMWGSGYIVRITKSNGFEKLHSHIEFLKRNVKIV